MNKNKSIAFCGIFIAVALIFSYIETLIPMSFAIPGVKIGLANVVTIYILIKLGLKEAIIVSVIRVVLSSILFGNIAALAFSLTGALLSITVMFILKKARCFSVVGISICGGVFHNIAQIGVAIIVMNNVHIVYYLPVLLVSGIIFGMLMGIVANYLIKNVEIEEN